jgi:hypothetical protein
MVYPMTLAIAIGRVPRPQGKLPAVFLIFSNVLMLHKPVVEDLHLFLSSNDLSANIRLQRLYNGAIKSLQWFLKSGSNSM